MTGPILTATLLGCVSLLLAGLAGGPVWRAGWRRGRRRLLVRVGLAPARWTWTVAGVVAAGLGGIAAVRPGDGELGGAAGFAFVGGVCLVLVLLPAWLWAERARQALEDLAPGLLDLPASEALRRLHRPQVLLPDQVCRPFYEGATGRPHLGTLHDHAAEIAQVAHRRPYQRWQIRQGRTDRAALAVLGVLVVFFSLARVAARLDWLATGGHPWFPGFAGAGLLLATVVLVLLVLAAWAGRRRDRQRSLLPAKALTLPLRAVLPEVRAAVPVARGSGDPLPVQAFELAVTALAGLAPATGYWQELRDAGRRPGESAGYRIGGMTAVTGTVVRRRSRGRRAGPPERLQVATVALRGPLTRGAAVAVVPHGTSARRWRQWNLESATFEDRFDLLATDRAVGSGVLPLRSAEAVLCLPEGCGVVVVGSVVVALGFRPLPPAGVPVLLSTALVVAALIPEHLLEPAQQRAAG